MSKHEVLKQVTFGERVAEEESASLARYFVQTDEWRRIRRGDSDIVYGAKGSGKSAIYSRLLASSEDLEREGIVLVAGENPRGNTVFRDLATDPPLSQEEFRALWKLYFAAVAAEEIRRRGIVSDDADSLISHLTEARILSDDHTLRRVYRGVRDYIRRFFKPDSLETGIQFDAQSGLPSGIIGKISLNEPSSAAESIGVIALDRLIELADRAFASAGLKLWIALDRLDVAFADNLDLEQNALRALFSVYLDLRSVQSVVLKIFLRSDIWRRITKAGFREASHIVRTVTIRWNTQSLLNLVVQRALNNQVIREFYVVTPDTILGDSEQQEIFFYRVFPDKVEGGEKKPRTFDWILSHTRDSSDEVAPRELIHLLAEAQAAQLKRFETGFAEPHGEALFDRPCLKEAMLPVSKVRLEQTLLAEHPDLREIILKLEGEKTEQTLGSLSRIWDVREEEAATLAAQLVDVGFFQKPDSKENPSFWVPFLYRPGLEMVQGRAGDE